MDRRLFFACGLGHPTFDHTATLCPRRMAEEELQTNMEQT